MDTSFGHKCDGWRQGINCEPCLGERKRKKKCWVSDMGRGRAGSPDGLPHTFWLPCEGCLGCLFTSGGCLAAPAEAIVDQSCVFLGKSARYCGRLWLPDWTNPKANPVHGHLCMSHRSKGRKVRRAWILDHHRPRHDAHPQPLEA